MTSLRKLEAVIFDFDGTLVDTVGDVTFAVNSTLLDVGVPKLADEEIRAAIGTGGEALIRRALEVDGRPARADLVRFLNEDYQARYLKAPVVFSTIYQSATVVLEWLRQSAVALAICTNKRQALVAPILKTFGLQYAFNNVVCADSLGCMKPDPLLVAAALAGFGCDPANVVLVGDTAVDSTAARNAGIRFIHARYGYGSLPGLSFPYAIDALSELPEALEAQGLQIDAASRSVGRVK